MESEKKRTKRKGKIEEDVEVKVSSNSFCKQPKKTKVIKEDKSLDTSFVLKDINYISLDRNYGMKDIQDFIFKNISKNETKDVENKILNIDDKIPKIKNISNESNSIKSSITSILTSSSNTNQITNKNEIKSITTKLENLGFSDKVKEPFETICRGNTKNNIYTTFNSSIKKDLVNNCTNFNCWYCRHSLIPNTLPVVIPLKYYNSYAECSLVHNSLINTLPKLEYKIMEESISNLVKDKDKVFYEKVNLTQSDKNKLPLLDKSVSINDYFEGEGVFCSFNCVVAFISENYSIKYKNTGLLLNKLYKNIFGFLPKEKILPSPSWKMLKTYGGDLSIEEYRKTFQVIDYSCNWQYLKNFPNGPVSELYLEKKF